MIDALKGFALLVYLAGFGLMFALHTQMPVTLGLAIVRSACWPVSLVLHDLWPRGTPTYNNDGDDE